MKHRVDASLVREAREFRLEWSCEACAHFDEPGQRCGNGYPVAEHRRVELEPDATLVFCKEFELA